jgi:hypothetical protein
MKRYAIILALAVCAFAAKPTAPSSHIKLYVAPMNGGLETYISAAIIKKRVPVTVTTNREDADLILEGSAESQKAGWAKILLTRNANSTEEASIRLIDKTGSVKYAYAYHTGSSFHGKQSAAESCAKHLGEYLRQQQEGKQ